MHRNLRLAATLLLLFNFSYPEDAVAQDSLSTDAAAPTAVRPAADSAAGRFARFLRYPWNGVNVWAGNAIETRSASHNQHIAGSMRIVGVQVSRDVWRGAHARIAYLGEVLPVMLVRSGPPLGRGPDTIHYYAPKELARYRFREGYGFGLAPFGIEMSRDFTQKLSGVFNMTAGALLFNKVIPYGAATMANFTVSPGVALELEPVNRTRIAVGYTFHHLSNASFGQSNPGMNSQILFVRIARERRGIH